MGRFETLVIGFNRSGIETQVSYQLDIASATFPMAKWNRSQ